MSEARLTELLNQCNRIDGWLSSQMLAPGSLSELTLPFNWIHLSHDGMVQVGCLSDGNRCFLLKQQMGWKENFSGIVYCDRPLNQAEIIESPSAVSYISLVGLETFEELYIHERLSDQLFEVYFDLN